MAQAGCGAVRCDALRCVGFQTMYKARYTRNAARCRKQSTFVGGGKDGSSLDLTKVCKKEYVEDEASYADRYGLRRVGKYIPREDVCL